MSDTDIRLARLADRLIALEDVVNGIPQGVSDFRFAQLEKAQQAALAQLQTLQAQAELVSKQAPLTRRDVENVVDAQLMKRMEEIINPLADAVVDAEKRCKYYADEIAAAARRDASVARSASMSSAESAADFLRSMASWFGR